MSGGKETPRAKMIGMMYLVLTALLALQVSNSVLEKFIFINRVLENTVKEGSASNSDVVSRISQAVEKAGNRAEDIKVLDRAKEVRVETQKVLTALKSYKDEVIELTGGVDENGQYIGVKDEDKIANMMINKGRGEDVRSLLNDYSSFLSKETGDEEFSPIALDAWDNPVFKDDPNQNKKDFSHLNFEHTPMAAGLATFSQFQAEVINYESTALDDLARQVGAKDIKFDKIVVMVRPESKIVAAGAKYRAEMFIAASSSGITPEMAYEGKSLEVTDGMGKVEFTATGGSYDKDGNVKKTFKATITLNDSTYVNDIEYIVAKPVIQIQSASVQALYLNCGNELQINVPALGADYQPAFTAKGATLINGGGGKVTVVPNAAKVALSVSSSGNFIGTENFGVRRIPKPTVEVMDRGKVVNEKVGMAAPGPRSLDIKAIPDASFAEFLPKDSRYRISEWEITLARGSRPVDSQTVPNEKANLSSFASKAKPGDRIVIEVKKVQRMNFKNQVEEVNVGTIIKTIPLH